MPIILVFDTETTGFTPLMNMPKKTFEQRQQVKTLESQLLSETPSVEAWSEWSPKWNNIIQISYIIYNSELNQFQPFDDYIDLSEEFVQPFLEDPDTHYTVRNALEAQQESLTPFYISNADYL